MTPWAPLTAAATSSGLLSRVNRPHWHPCGVKIWTGKVIILNQLTFRYLFSSNFPRFVLRSLSQVWPISRGTNPARNDRVPVLGSLRPSTLVSKVAASGCLASLRFVHVPNDLESCSPPIELSSVSLCSYDSILTLSTSVCVIPWSDLLDHEA